MILLWSNWYFEIFRDLVWECCADGYVIWLVLEHSFGSNINCNFSSSC